MIFDISVIPYSLPFSSEIIVFDQVLTAKQGAFVLVQSGDFMGIGDVSPLPGLSAETVSESLQALSELSQVSFSQFDDFLSGDLFCIPSFSGIASVQFALESAFLSMLSSYSSFSVLTQSLGYTGISQVQSPGSVVKCKIGRRSIEEDVADIKNFAQTFPHVRLRLDANGRYSLDEICSLVMTLPAGCVDYVEDPCAEPDQYDTFFERTGVNYAIDCISGDIGMYGAGLGALVVKPGVLGSVQSILALQDATTVNVVFSSAFESCVGLNSIARLAFLLSPTAVHGLSTVDYFTEPGPVSVENGVWKGLSTSSLIQWAKML